MKGQVFVIKIQSVPMSHFWVSLTIINKCTASGYTVYLLVNSISKIMLHLQMLYSQLENNFTEDFS